MIKQSKPSGAADKPRGAEQKMHPARTAQKPAVQAKGRSADEPGAAGFASARADEDTYD